MFYHCFNTVLPLCYHVPLFGIPPKQGHVVKQWSNSGRTVVKQGRRQSGDAVWWGGGWCQCKIVRRSMAQGPLRVPGVGPPKSKVNGARAPQGPWGRSMAQGGDVLSVGGGGPGAVGGERGGGAGTTMDPELFTTDQCLTRDPVCFTTVLPLFCHCFTTRPCLGGVSQTRTCGTTMVKQW